MWVTHVFLTLPRLFLLENGISECGDSGQGGGVEGGERRRGGALADHRGIWSALRGLWRGCGRWRMRVDINVTADLSFFLLIVREREGVGREDPASPRGQSHLWCESGHMGGCIALTTKPVPPRKICSADSLARRFAKRPFFFFFFCALALLCGLQDDVLAARRADDARSLC